MQLEDAMRATMREILATELDGRDARLLAAFEDHLATMREAIIAEMRRPFDAAVAALDAAPGATSTTDEAADRNHAAPPRQDTEGSSEPDGAPVSRWPTEVPSPITDEFIADIVEQYREALAAGEPPVKTIMERYDRSRSSVSAWVKRARTAGHLPEAEPGKATA